MSTNQQFDSVLSPRRQYFALSAEHVHNEGKQTPNKANIEPHLTGSCKLTSEARCFPEVEQPGIQHRTYARPQSNGSSKTTVCNVSGVNSRNAIQGWFSKWCRDWWGLEIGSMFLGSICMMVIAIMLRKVDGQEVPRWQLGATIDAILSLLSGFSKSCLLMPTAEALGQAKWALGKHGPKRAVDIERIDRATRGSWGSIALLIRSRGM